VAARDAPAGFISVYAKEVDTDIWRRVVALLNTDAVALALVSRMEGGNQDAATLEAMKEQLESIDGTIEQLTKMRKNLRRQQETAFDDAEYEELEGRIQQAGKRLRELADDRRDLSEQLESVTGVTFEVGDLLSRVQVRAPDNFPKPGEPGFEKALAGALDSYLEANRESAITVASEELSVQEKRALLRWLGARVEVYSLQDKQSDDTRWELIFSAPEGCGPFPLDGSTGTNIVNITPTKSSSPR
jgi:hypothetical protein